MFKRTWDGTSSIIGIKGGCIRDDFRRRWMLISCIIQVSMAVASVMPADTYDGCVLDACSHQWWMHPGCMQPSMHATIYGGCIHHLWLSVCLSLFPSLSTVLPLFVGPWVEWYCSCWCIVSGGCWQGAGVWISSWCTVSGVWWEGAVVCNGGVVTVICGSELTDISWSCRR